MGVSKKKLSITGLSVLILVAMVVAVAIGVSRRPGSDSSGKTPKEGQTELQTSSKAIRQICQPTDYKEACEQSLTAADKNHTSDPKTLIKLAFEVAIEELKKVDATSEALKQAAKDERTTEALEDCKELMGYSIDDLKASMDRMGDFALNKLDDLVYDMKIWLSGSMTYQETCLDGFEGTKGDASEKMKHALKRGVELTDNALAIVNQISSTLNRYNFSFLNRRLFALEDVLVYGLPDWASQERRHLIELPVDKITPNATVAKDGSGQFKTITEALAKAPLKSNDTFVIYIKEGIYNEYVEVPKKLWNVVMIGDGPEKTVITGNKNFIDGTPTFKTATFAAVGEGFMAKDIGFENTAGAAKHQAVAIRVQSDKSIFYNCRMDAYQDTLYAHTHRQYYRECTITGTVDFIFGNSAVVFQNCKMMVRKPMDNQRNIVTAQGRKDGREPTGIVLHNCTITGEPDYMPLKDKNPSFLGRPWKMYSRTMIMQSVIDEAINPEGWLPWHGDFGLNTCFYAEFDNRGPGASTAQRVKWQGIKTVDEDQVQQFTVKTFIHGDEWLKASGIPYTPGLLPIYNRGPSAAAAPAPN